MAQTRIAGNYIGSMAHLCVSPPDGTQTHVRGACNICKARTGSTTHLVIHVLPRQALADVARVVQLVHVLVLLVNTVKVLVAELAARVVRKHVLLQRHWAVQLMLKRELEPGLDKQDRLHVTCVCWRMVHQRATLHMLPINRAGIHHHT